MKILIDEAVVRQALEDFVDIKYGLEKSRIWVGMDWTYNPMHPVHYLPLRDRADVQISALHQALADAALDKKADNARELGLDYEQPAHCEAGPEYCPQCHAEQSAPAQEPCGWQFFQDGKWYNGMDTNDHRSHTEAAGFPTRDVYPLPPPAQPLTDEQERQAFEAYALHTPFGSYLTKRRGDGGYYSSHIHLMWGAWQARAAHGSGEKK